MDRIAQVRESGKELLASLDECPIWLGSVSGYVAAREVAREVALRMLNLPADQVAAMMAKEDEEEPSLLETRGSVGVLKIHGPLVRSSSWITRMFGITSYPDIRNALVEAANSGEVKKVLLHIDSPGGHVVGVQETANLIGAVNKMKPVTSFTDGSMASAAYWLGVSSKKVLATADASVGSIGVVMVHMDVSESLKKEGVKATVMRAGKYKMLVNPYEPLSDAAKKEIQAQLDATYDGFVGHVASSLGKSPDLVDEKMAQGRVFIGQKAVDVGLVHRLATFSEVLTALDSQYAVDISKRMNKNQLRP